MRFALRNGRFATSCPWPGVRVSDVFTTGRSRRHCWRSGGRDEGQQRVACRDPPVESSSRQADIEPSRPVRRDGSLCPATTHHPPSLRAIAVRRVDSKAPWGASSQSCRRPPTLSRSHRDALPRVCNEPPEASNIQCFRDGRPRARLGRSRQEILDTTTLKAQHSCRFAGRSSGRLLIRRSLVRAQVGEPEVNQGSDDVRPLSHSASRHLVGAT